MELGQTHGTEQSITGISGQLYERVCVSIGKRQRCQSASWKGGMTEQRFMNSSGELSCWICVRKNCLSLGPALLRN